MSLRRRKLNITLLVLASVLAGAATWLTRLAPPAGISTDMEASVISVGPDSAAVLAQPVPVDTLATPVETRAVEAPAVSELETPVRKIDNTAFRDAEPSAMLNDHPFRKEALKVLNGHLEEKDSLSRRKILSYCEHLRTAYTSRDIDFIRQVFSDNALIIVGHVVKNARADMKYSDKVQYSIRTKKEYIERLAKIFDSKKKLDLQFSDFRIMRHPTMPGIYGVTLRQKYACDTYSDDGWLFLLWDFRNPSMPTIHVRTWQPSQILGDEGDIIDISDFNLE
ncbi:MAG: hypothetical protein HDS65_04680 [Bacteroidales bacterium]|nr:hypothetical protein [Bacteroidales bacterium]